MHARIATRKEQYATLAITREIHNEDPPAKITHLRLTPAAVTKSPKIPLRLYPHTSLRAVALFGLIVNVARSLAAPLVFFLLFAPLLPIYS